MNGTLTLPRSSPVNAPTHLQEKLDLLTTIEYSSITLSVSLEYDVSYGAESLPAICEYGEHNQNCARNGRRHQNSPQKN